ncbi:MAG: tetratricopeptide repeat protein [Acetobacteraceae bacterium]
MHLRHRIRVLLWLALLAPAGALAAADPAPSADLVAGIKAYNEGNIGTALSRLKAAADRGEAEAMVNLGYIYARGQAGVADPARALTLYRKAAALGDGEGMNAVGYRLDHADPPDLPGAIAWYCRAVLKGNQRAMNNLALLAYAGRGTPRDRAEARLLWRQASERGNLQARASLGADLASDASLNPTERQQGYDMLRDAAMNGGAHAQELLRRAGSTERFPPPTVSPMTMQLEPRNVPPGTSNLCGRVLS